MPYYTDLNKLNPGVSSHIAERLLSLKKGLIDSGVPKKSFHKLLLATWNIREFDSPSFGRRTDESIYYIAEIISHFDLVAIQEVRDDLDGLRRLMDVLGKNWKVIFTDVTEGRAGNKERMAYIFDARKIEFGGLASELVLSPEKKSELSGHQWARTPFAVGFHAGWYRFMLVSAHLIYGKSGANSPERVKEMKVLSDFLAERSEKQTTWSDTIVLLGDFNIFNTETKTFEALAENFMIPDEIMTLPSNIKGNRHFDQIAFRTPYLNELVGSKSGVKAGVFNFFDYVFKEDDEPLYENMMGEKYEGKSEKAKSTYYKTYFRTHQMSDHLPMWIELPVDRSHNFLEDIQSGKSERGGGKNPNEQIRNAF